MNNKFLIFQILFLIHLKFNIVYSHFHSNKDFESTLIKCCEIGNQKATNYQTDQTSLFKINSKDNICSFDSKDLFDIPKELIPQCSSTVKLCCQRELNLKICRFSKSIVKQRFDNTPFNLNKNQINSTNLKLNDNYYQQCLPNPDYLRNENLSQNLDNRLFTKMILLNGNQEIYQECCTACKLGLFSALNDYKCIAQKNTKPSKMFEESFYDCCFNLKRNLDLASGKKVDISEMEILIYPELKELMKYRSIDLFQQANNQSKLNDESNSSKEFVTSQSLIDLDSINLNKKLEQQSKIMDNIRTQIIQQNINIPKDLRNLSQQSFSCLNGTRLDSNSNVCVDIDECKENKHDCKIDEKCVNLNPYFKCIKNEYNLDQQNKNNEQFNQNNKFKSSMNSSLNLYDQNKRSQLANHKPPYTRYIPNNPVKPVYIKRKLIDKCKIGNHNCDQQTQTCRSKEDGFVCINNDEIEEYDKLHPFIEDYLTSYTELPIRPENNKLRNANLFDQLVPEEKSENKKICPNGFQLNSESNQCEDVNECEIGTHNCTLYYRCDNKIGSFICVREQSCGSGYVYNQDRNICEDIDECKLNLDHCRKPFICVNYPGTFRCEMSKCQEVGHRLVNNKCVQVICAPGFIFNSLVEKCVDIDECLVGVDISDINSIYLNGNEKNYFDSISKLERLSNGRFAACDRTQRCINHLGGFSCQNLQNEIENNLNSNNLLGRKYANRVEIIDNRPIRYKSCLFGERFDLNRMECVDIDECKEKLDNCASLGVECINEKPGYSCKCKDGSKWNPINRACKSINGECKILDASNFSIIKNLKNFDINKTKFCNYKCNQINGEWSCDCPSGFISKFNGTKCVDIDECKVVNNLCKSTNGESSFCFNLRGSYECIDIKCPPGYIKDYKNILQCVIIDKSKIYFNKPKYISYSFISLQSYVNTDSKVASIKGSSSLNLEWKLISANSTIPDFDQNNLARMDDFIIKRIDGDNIYLKRSLIGPQQIKLEFIYTTNQNDKKITMNKLTLIIYISKFNF